MNLIKKIKIHKPKNCQILESVVKKVSARFFEFSVYTLNDISQNRLHQLINFEKKLHFYGKVDKNELMEGWQMEV